MVSIKDIPAEVRWELATKSTTAYHINYDMLYRVAFEDQIDDLETRFWSEAEIGTKKIADALSLPVKDAVETNSTFSIVA